VRREVFLLIPHLSCLIPNIPLLPGQNRKTGLVVVPSGNSLNTTIGYDGYGYTTSQSTNTRCLDHIQPVKLA